MILLLRSNAQKNLLEKTIAVCNFVFVLRSRHNTRIFQVTSTSRSNTKGDEIQQEEPANKTILEEKLDIDLDELARKEKEAQNIL